MEICRSRKKFSASNMVMKMTSCLKCIVAISMLVDLVCSPAALFFDVVMRLNGRGCVFSRFPVLRRVSIYMLSYVALVVVNNTGYELPNMWVVYTPMFIGVYIFSRWVDAKLAARRAPAELEE